MTCLCPSQPFGIPGTCKLCHQLVQLPISAPILRAARLSDDHRTVTLDLPEIAPTWCMESRYSLQGADGTPVQANIHNTVHRLGN